MKQRIATFILGAVLFFFGLGAVLLNGGDQWAQAAPPAAPTPVANILQTDKGTFFRFQPETVITEDTNTNSVEVLGFDSLDISYTVDVDASVNTTTLTIQYSNDGSNWVDGLALGSALAADATDITRVPVFGRYMRVEQDVTNSNEITFTILAVGR